MSASLTPENLAELLKLQKIAQQYPDYPKNFIPPAFLDPHYVPPFKASGTGLVITGIILFVMLVFVVPLRLLVRIKYRTTTWGWDDIMIIPATILALVINVLSVVQVYQGTMGYHTYDTSYDKLQLAYKTQFIQMHLYFWCSFLIKVSILAFYMRIWPKGQGHIFLKSFMAFLLIVNLISVLLVVFNFTPIRAAWDLSALIEPHKGKNFSKRLFIQSVIYSVIDVGIWAMPIPVVWRLRTSLKKRLGLIALFSLGFVACAAVIVRTPLIFHAMNTFDGTWAMTDVALCSQLETGIAIIVASLPAINAISHTYFSKMWSGFSRRMRSAYSYLSSSTRSKVVPTKEKLGSSHKSKDSKQSKETSGLKESAKDSTAVDSTLTKSPKMFLDTDFNLDRDLEACPMELSQISRDEEYLPAPLNPRPKIRVTEVNHPEEQEPAARPSREGRRLHWPLTLGVNKTLSGNRNNQGDQMRNVFEFTTRADSPVEEDFAAAEVERARRGRESAAAREEGNNSRNLLMFTTVADSPILEDDPDFGASALGIQPHGSPVVAGASTVAGETGTSELSVSDTGNRCSVSPSSASNSNISLPIEGYVGAGAGRR